jgi:hypothetical protein
MYLPWYLVYFQYCVTMTTINFQNSYHLKKKPHNLPSHTPSPPLHNHRTSLMFSVFMNLPIVDIIYKWNHTIYAFCVCILSLSVMFLRFIQVVVCTNLYSFSWLNDSPSYMIHYILFLCSSVDGHLGYLYLLAIVNSAAMNEGTLSY